jgi:hypothetical protein
VSGSDWKANALKLANVDELLSEAESKIHERKNSNAKD